MWIMMLISPEYKEQNRLLHESPTKFGQRGHRHLDKAKELIEKYDCKTVLDYGCGKADLSKHAPFSVENYDPGIPEFDKEPKKCDLVVCTDVLEHIEPDYLINVIEHIKYKMNKAGYFVIATRYDRSKTLPDGSNPHKIVNSAEWWLSLLLQWFKIVEYENKEGEVYLECAPLQ